MKKINWEDVLKRVKEGESLGSIAKSYGIHKHYLTTIMFLNLKNKGVIFDIVEHLSNIAKFVKTTSNKKNSIELEINKLSNKYGKSEEEITELLNEYIEVKNCNVDLINDYDKYKVDFENIIEKKKEIGNNCVLFAEEYDAWTTKGANKYFKQGLEFVKAADKYNFVHEVRLLMMQEINLSRAIQVVNEKMNKSITYSKFVKDINLMGFKVNSKANIMYHIEESDIKEIAQSCEASILLEEYNEIKFKRGYKENDDLYKELEIIALEKGLTKDEFTRVILSKYLDSNYPKVREFE